MIIRYTNDYGKENIFSFKYKEGEYTTNALVLITLLKGALPQILNLSYKLHKSLTEFGQNLDAITHSSSPYP